MILLSAFTVAVLGILAAARVLVGLEPGRRTRPAPLPSAAPPRAPAIPIAVLGDSDSQSYQDRIWFPPGGPERGGERRAATLQWTEVLARLRPHELDFGAWGVWGSRSAAVRLMDWCGVRGRAPRKEDFRHNFAFAGAHGADLMLGNWRQAPRLADLMDEAPERWRRGVVVIRIGVVDFGGEGSLDQLSRDAQAPAVRAAMQDCLGHVQAAVRLLHSRHPETRVVLVGILDNADYPGFLARWRSRAELDRIRAGLDFYDGGLRALAAADPRVAFFDDRAWFRAHWGARDAEGMPAYGAVSPSPRLTVAHRCGDDPASSVLADCHAGVAWNTLWAQDLTILLRNGLGLPVQPIGAAEVAHFLDQELQLAP